MIVPSRKVVVAKNVIKHQTGDVRNPNRVQIPVVGGSRETELGKAQLLDLPQTLKLGRVNDLRFGVAQFNSSMHGVSNFHLQKIKLIRLLINKIADWNGAELVLHL